MQDVSVLEAFLWPKGARRDVWMIVDAARDRRIFGMLLDGFYSDHMCLFSGPLTPALSRWLRRISFALNTKVRKRSVLWRTRGETTGVCFSDQVWDARSCDVTFVSSLLVHDSRGDRLFFRYYDPRVLRVYLPTCTRDELRTVFGGIECFWMEDEKPAIVLNADFDQTRLVMRELPLER